MPKPLSIDEFVQKKSTPVASGSTGTNAQALSIEEFAKKKSAAPTTTAATAPKKPSLLKEIGIGMARLPVRASLNVMGAVDAVRGIFGNEEAGRRAIKLQNEGIDSPTFGHLTAIGNTGKGFVADVKDAVGAGFEGASYIPVVRGPAVGAQILKGSIMQGLKRGAVEGAIGGTLAGAGNEMQNTESTPTDIVKSAVTGGAIGTAGGAIIGGGTAAVPSVIAARAVAREKKVTDAIGRVLQGEIKDIETGRKVLSTIDMSDVKSYKQGEERLNEQIRAIRTAQDKALETNKATRVLNNLNLKTTVGGETVQQNYVKDALDQLETYYTKTNNAKGIATVKGIRQQAESGGLTAKEINDIAILHGKDLNAFNASGELASGLSKQAAENTRAGVKATSRDLFGNNIARAADAELTKIIRVRDLFKDMNEKVNTLQQKIQQRSLGNRVGRLVEQATNIVSMGTARGFVEAIVPRGMGYKTLNALDLEKQLQKNLKLIQRAENPFSSEQDIIKALEQFIRNAGEQPVLALPAPGQTARSKTNPFFVGPKGSASQSLQEASDASGQNVKIPQ